MMDFEISGPVFSGVLGASLAAGLCILLRRWVPEIYNGKNAATLVGENRAGLWLANSLFFCGIISGILIYQFGFLPKSDWRGLALGVGGGSIAALAALFLFALVRRKSPKETYVAFAIMQSTPNFLLYGMLILSIAAFAAAASSLWGDSAAWVS
jgi:hypothetical protein